MLFASGFYSSLLHAQDPPTFIASSYGRALLVKLALVFVIVALAGVNRIWLLPRFTLKRGNGLRTALRAELVVLVTVFVATGILSTRPLPHSGEAPNVGANLQSLWSYLNAR